jgi:hypothetical protein
VIRRAGKSIPSGRKPSHDTDFEADVAARAKPPRHSLEGQNGIREMTQQIHMEDDIKAAVWQR